MTNLRTHRHRVAQWAIGTIGFRGLRSVIEHPHLKPAAVHVFGAGTVGADAGDRAPRPRAFTRRRTRRRIVPAVSV
ncbi:hypothetical protein ABQF34_23735 [Mycolicibacterium boenickei]